MLALFLILRLRSVLGKRTGNERPHVDPFQAPPSLPGRPDMAHPDAPRPEATRPDYGPNHGPSPSSNQGKAEDNVISLPERGEPAGAAARDAAQGPADELAEGIARIRSLDRRFDAAQFLSGARAAFEMIIGAFAAGDRKALRALLSDDVYDNFAREIGRRERDGEVLDNKILHLVSADVIEARLEGRNGLLTVKFVSEQINILRHASGEPLPGQPTAPSEVIDVWTFARDLRSSDPNWQLVATGTAH